THDCDRDDFEVECPTGSGKMMNLWEVSQELSRRLIKLFLRGEDGRRPAYGGGEKFQRDQHWRDQILFFEYFHGDNGAGLGASHQNRWTGLGAKLIQQGYTGHRTAPTGALDSNFMEESRNRQEAASRCNMKMGFFPSPAPTIPASYNLRSIRRRFRSACGGMTRECGTTQKYSQTSHKSSSVVIQFIRSNRFKLI